MANLTKVQFAASVRIYIQHKQVLEKYSNWYRNDAIAKSMSKCYELLKMVKRDCANYSIQQLAQMVMINQDNLTMILPAPNNPSYERQKNKIEKIIQTSKEILK